MVTSRSSSTASSVPTVQSSSIASAERVEPLPVAVVARGGADGVDLGESDLALLAL